MKKITTSLFISVLLFNICAYAQESKGTFYVDPKLETKKEFRNKEIKAWETDFNGNVKVVKPINKALNDDDKPSLCTPSDGYIYQYDHYDLNYTKTDKKHFYVSSVSIENRTGSSVTLKYVQQQSKTTKWDISVNLEGETSAGNEFLAKIKVKAGIDVTKESVSYASTTVEFTATVRSQYEGIIEKYKGGINGSGAMAYRKYSPSGTSWIGMYYETAGGWAVTDDRSYVLREIRL
jgi:hypothetical protein